MNALLNLKFILGEKRQLPISRIQQALIAYVHLHCSSLCTYLFATNLHVIPTTPRAAEKGMNYVAMTFTNPFVEFGLIWGSIL